jgi:cobalt/nickel transport system permease protein
MHIPDGYLSPSTCATLYGFATAGWYTALKKTKRLLATRTIPLISVFAAFSFVVMMFNVPLPGGTTGHALGVAVATIVLGPWGSVLAISIALSLQALFFGDGGITTLGANCFNMAIAGSLVAHAMYVLVSGRVELASRRRIFAAAIAGYAAINASALLTAFEFGIQPLLFHDTNGMPLYAPYPLRIALPAMMVGHLTFAGLAEGIISAGMIAYLQRTDISILRGGSFGAEQIVANRSHARATPVWLVVALMMVFTPVGILAAGTAWGEWSPAELSDRARTATPAGLERLATLWTAPFPSYAPAFVKHHAFGYFLSAIFGVGFLLLGSLLVKGLAARSRRPEFRP